MGEDDRVDRVGVHHDDGVSGSGAVDADVHERDLHDAEKAERPDRLALSPGDQENIAAPRDDRVAEDDDGADGEAEEGHADRRDVSETELDGHGIGAPEDGEHEREDGAFDIEGAVDGHESGYGSMRSR